ncbi:mitochondrial carrier [Atractiella rhizophila]|nr:mitochondrial carrier [Atractiella rhizophila]
MSGSASSSKSISFFPAQSWVHFVAGGTGGMCGAIATAPFDLVKTRLQSDLYDGSGGKKDLKGKGKEVVGPSRSGIRRAWVHFRETGGILRDIYKYEGPRALFKGLGPTLVGVVPARSINFFTYGNGKQMYAHYLNDGKENPAIHLLAGFTAGLATATFTNPIWVVKTRLQLENSQREPSSAKPSTSHASSSSTASTSSRHVSSTSSIRTANAYSTAAIPQKTTSVIVIRQILKNEGIKGYYRGLSASYLGCAEGTLQWTLYEQFKRLGRRDGKEVGTIQQMLASGGAKLIATAITYPHEVVRTRLRQAPPANGELKYKGLWQTFRVIAMEEGVVAFYGGMSAHLMRVIPNAVVMFYVYEGALKLFQK